MVARIANASFANLNGFWGKKRLVRAPVHFVPETEFICQTFIPKICLFYQKLLFLWPLYQLAGWIKVARFQTLAEIRWAGIRCPNSDVYSSRTFMDGFQLIYPQHVRIYISKSECSSRTNTRAECVDLSVMNRFCSTLWRQMTDWANCSSDSL